MKLLKLVGLLILGFLIVLLSMDSVAACYHPDYSYPRYYGYHSYWHHRCYNYPCYYGYKPYWYRPYGYW